jgi:hypothetical protein
MEMLERCPGCSVAREVEAKKKAETGPTFVSSSRRSRPCVNCGYDGPFLPPDDSSARDSLPSFAGARAKLATATQDLFRLSGSHSLPSHGSNSIPVEASVSEPPPPKAPEAPVSSTRKPEASIMFSLEALMKANQAPAKPGGGADDASSQLWNMQTAEPLFGTAADEALLTTPLKMEPAQSMDSMTLPSETPNARRWWPIALAATAGLALAAGGIWVFGSGSASVNAPTAASEQAALEAQPPVEAPPVLPAPGEPATGALPAPSEPQAVAPAQPSADPAPNAVGDAPGASAPTGLAAAGVAAAGVAAARPALPVEPAKEKDKGKPSARKPPARAPAPRAVAPVSSNALVPFDKAAAKAALNGAAAQAASCGAGGAPGKGKIQVTFAPSGKVSDAQLVEGPFAGTTAGKCALSQFRAAKVPAFGGAPVTVAKSFKVD